MSESAQMVVHWENLGNDLWIHCVVPYLSDNVISLYKLSRASRYFWKLFEGDDIWSLLCILEMGQRMQTRWKPSQVFHNTWSEYTTKPNQMSYKEWFKRLSSPDLSWMEKDQFSGMRQSKDNPKIWFAISKTNRWKLRHDYEPPRGYHWASAAEYFTFFKNKCTESAYSGALSNWHGYEYNGVFRHGYVFCDTYQFSIYRHESVQQLKDLFQGGIDTTDNVFGNCFAGIVVMEDTKFTQEELDVLEKEEARFISERLQTVNKYGKI